MSRYQPTSKTPENNPKREANSADLAWGHSNPFLRSDRDSGSRKKAISAMSAHCMGCTREEQEPGWRDDVRNCKSVGCPLWRFRAYQRGAANE